MALELSHWEMSCINLNTEVIYVTYMNVEGLTEGVCGNYELYFGIFSKISDRE
jgi:hypothetical protein